LPDAIVETVCGYCSTGCGLQVHLKEGLAVNLSADPEYPVNVGMACPKGWEALAPLRATDRGRTPLLRTKRGAPLQPCDWDQALDIFCQRLRSFKERSGVESVAFLSTGQITTEEMAFLGCLFKFGLGFVHCDSNTRQCMATTHVAYKESFGFDAPPYSYNDLQISDVLVFVGANPCIAHPVMWQWVSRNPHQPEILVVDPRRTETAAAATQHYPISPKSDLWLLYGVAHLLIRSGAVRTDFVRAHTTGFAEFAQFVQAFNPKIVAEKCGLTVSQLEQLANTVARGKRVSFWWTMGVNQGHEATRIAQAIINLVLMTGNIGRPGTGANSITGQCNAMGSRLFANITSLLGGYDFTNPAHRQKIANILQIGEARIPSTPSWAYDQILDAIEDGKIKALWVVATNGAHSWIEQGRFRDLLGRLEFLVVQDLYPTTETARLADLYLPAAGWGEKDGTFINSERRIGLTRRVAAAPGESRSDFAIFQAIAQRWGCDEMFERWNSPEAVFEILKEVSAGQPCDITGIEGYQMLAAAGGIQWPWRLDESGGNGLPPRYRRLFTDGRFYTTDGKAKFVFESPRPVPERPDANYPFWLITGRGTSAQWHTNTRTGKSAILRQLYPAECYIEIHPEDAAKLGIGARQRVGVVSRRGAISAVAFITPTVRPGQVFVPMHYPEVNRLTLSVFDPYSRQPSYKACAVRVL
ncbi:MAG: nitrate reductase, partial [Verrucomicrobia bacterium]|nr:nitrate reductase [Verrucomicrobiota bacterium]